jgi:hypothetical protein
VAGWIKLEKDLYTDPRLRRMATRLAEMDLAAGRTPQPYSRLLTTCVGAVSILWITADTHVQQDDLLALGPAEIEQLTGVEGICEILPDEWLVVLDPHTVKLPGFHTHNGTEAKNRAQTKARVERHRSRQKAHLRNGL